VDFDEADRRRAGHEGGEMLRLETYSGAGGQAGLARHQDNSGLAGKIDGEG
jgi:hypothetical protein